MADMNPSISEEIWMEILKFLPVKTLGQCRCVSKSWESLIVSPPFMSAHLKNYTKNEANSILLYKQTSLPPLRQEQYTLFHDSVDGKGANLEVCHPFTCPLVPSKNPYYFTIVGSVNGLLCLIDECFRFTALVFLWNPLLHKYIIVPVPKALYRRENAEFTSVFGFGYDSTKSDYKVVRLVYLQDHSNSDITPPNVECYSVLEANWKAVSAANVVGICICHVGWSQCFANGAIHWVAWERDTNRGAFLRNCLLVFDVEQEKFKKMKLPKALKKVSTLDLRVSECDGKLSMIHSVIEGGLTGKQMNLCEIWIKREYSVGRSWNKVVSVDLSASVGLRWVLCMKKNGEVLGVTDEGELVAYDPDTQQSKGLGLCGVWRSWFTIAYSESLSLLDKKSGVYTYAEAGRQKKKRYFNEMCNGVVVLIEEDIDIEEDDDWSKAEGQPAGLFEDRQYQMLVEDQSVKFSGGLVDISELDGNRMVLVPDSFWSVLAALKALSGSQAQDEDYQVDEDYQHQVEKDCQYQVDEEHHYKVDRQYEELD